MTKEVVDAAVAEYGTERTNLLPVLHRVSEEKHWLSEDDLTQIAKAFSLPAAEVHSVASFYSLLSVKPVGKYVIRVCRTISCHMNGKAAVMDALKKILDIELGETTQDNQFTLLETNCMGWCEAAPAMLINDTVHTNLTPEKVRDIISDYKNKRGS
ncbi:MAG: NADH-quinone oxidoreductase subunit NuoE [Alphaproteobacteria bacterium]|nr:NADH-quinone oxidoreductase subunit NuoE [Alphaproteobacteria bacterium]MCL2505191.1 NADH-quinone oxidoreductase subunit NuoE [Alphaproteobacteria bacterium]